MKKFTRAVFGKPEKIGSLEHLHALIIKSGLFDYDWYLAKYPDVASHFKWATDPVSHYLRHGASEGRNPSGEFKTQWYLRENPDVQQSGMNPLVHYILHGEAQGVELNAPKNRKLTPAANKKIGVIKHKYYTLGFTEHPLLDLQHIIEQHDKGYLHGLASLYSSEQEQEVVPLARAFHADSARYQAQVQLPLDYSKNHFSYEMQIDRLQAGGVGKQIVVDANIPAWSGKTSLDKLVDVKRQLYKPNSFTETDEMLFQFTNNGFKFDLFWRPKPGARKIFLFLSGFADRSKNAPPMFQRWSWAEHVPGHSLYISDPSLYLDPELGLAWYAGTKDYDPLPKIAAVLKDIVKQLGLSLADVVAYGSSGGGFAALRLALFLDDISVITINPQTDITLYYTGPVETYLGLCWQKINCQQAREHYPERISVVYHAKEGRYIGRKIIYLQNTVDTYHLENHFKPFCQALNVEPQTMRSETFNIVLFEHAGGHAKAETPEAFAEAMRIIGYDC